MRIRWRGLELPNKIDLDQDTSTGTYGKFTVEPFERGYGVTIGNSLRRVLLSSLEGAAVTSVKIRHTGKDDSGKEVVTDVSHEFMGLSGVYEDVTDIILNIKDILIKTHVAHPLTLKVKKTGAGEVTAGDIESSNLFDIVNPDLVLCTLVDDVTIEIEMQAKVGRGYHTAEENIDSDAPFGTIPIDSTYSPVRRVRYKTENTRVGQKTDFDRLMIEIWTDGTKTPEMAIVEASTLLRKHLNPFVKYFELGKEAEHEGAAIAMIAGGGDDEVKELIEKLSLPVSVLDPSVRASNCLSSVNVCTLGELAMRSEQSMMKIKNFGKGSLKEIKKKLADHGLSFGMELPEEVLTTLKGQLQSQADSVSVDPE